MIHGILKEGGIAHAWIEIIDNNIIFDGAQQKFYNKNEYYNILNVEIEREYTILEACTLVGQTGNYGAWQTIHEKAIIYFYSNLLF